MNVMMEWDQGKVQDSVADSSVQQDVEDGLENGQSGPVDGGFLKFYGEFMSREDDSGIRVGDGIAAMNIHDIASFMEMLYDFRHWASFEYIYRRQMTSENTADHNAYGLILKIVDQIPYSWEFDQNFIRGIERVSKNAFILMKCAQNIGFFGKRRSCI